MNNYEKLKSIYGYSLVGGYLKGANPYVFDSNTPNYKIGLSILGENYDFNKSLVDITKYASPAISCGTLSTLIDSGIEKIDNMVLKAESVFGPNKARERMEFLSKFANKLIKASVPIAYAEGADDDELKEDISVLLKQSKEEFEKRVKQNEEDLKKEKEENLTDENAIPDEEENADDQAQEEALVEDTGTDDTNADDFFSDDSQEEGSDDNDDTEDDDGWEEDSEDSGEETEDSDDQDNSAGDESEDVSEEDIPDGNLEGNSESYNGFATKADRLLYMYNSNVGYKENEKYRYGESYINIPKPEMKAMAESLLKIEEENFKAIGESYSFKDIVPDSKLQEAHSKYVEAQASIMVMRRKLNL